MLSGWCCYEDTSLSWNSSIRLYNRKYIGDADTEDWEEHYADWSDEDSITVNSLSVNIKAKELNNKLSPKKNKANIITITIVVIEYFNNCFLDGQVTYFNSSETCLK